MTMLLFLCDNCFNNVDNMDSKYIDNLLIH